MRTVLSILLLLAAGAAGLFAWRLGDAERRLDAIAGRAGRLEREREDLERRLLEVSEARERLVRDLPAMIERAVPASRPGVTLPVPPPAERLEMVALREQVNTALRQAGFPGLRLFRVRAVEERTLLGVQLHMLSGDGIAVEAYAAERLDFMLDLDKLVLTLRFVDGWHLADGRRLPLPDGGVPLTLERAAAVQLTAAIGHLLLQQGSLRAPAGPESRPADDRPGSTERSRWVDRLNELLRLAQPHERLSCLEIGSVQGEGFQDVVILGYAHGLVLDRTFEAHDLTVEVPSADSVVLCLKGGRLERNGRSVPLRDEGYRLLLPGVRPDQAARILDGRIAGRPAR